MAFLWKWGESERKWLACSQFVELESDLNLVVPY